MTSVEDVPQNVPNKPLKKAAIIDDAFDAVTENEIPYSSFKEFLQISNDRGILEVVLTKIGVTFPVMDAWNDDNPEYLEFLKTLWVHRNDPDLRSLINTPELFAIKLSKLEQVETLCKNIEKEHIEIHKFDSKLLNMGQFKQGEFVYIFIDYRLGISNDQHAVARAKEVAKQIYNLSPRDKRPVTILMSADPNADERVKAEFRNEGMLEGVIRFSPKVDLEDKGKVSLLIRAYGEEFASNHILQEYIRSLGAAAKSAQEQFEKEITALSIEDYEYMQNSILQTEKQPLGDYLGWLYGSHWAHLLFKDVGLKAMQSTIDRVISEKLPLHHSVPSGKLSQIFMTALFETDLETISYHPLAEEVRLPYLHLGDLFTKQGSIEVFMILNPQCDLERPSEKKKKQSILLIPGKLVLLDNVAEDRHPETDFFVFDEKMYRILWNIQCLTSIVYHEFETWTQKHELERKYRLRLPFALDIQQQFTSNISRIGLPVTPPMAHIILLEVYLRNHEGALIPVLGRSKEFAFLPLTRDSKEKVRFTLKFALDFKAAIIGQLDGFVRLKESYSTPVPSLEKIIEKIQKTIDIFDDWFFQYRSFAYPGNKPKNLDGLSISTILNAPLDELKDEKKFNSIFIMNLIEVEEVHNETANEGDETNRIIPLANSISTSPVEEKNN